MSDTMQPEAKLSGPELHAAMREVRDAAVRDLGPSLGGMSVLGLMADHFLYALGCTLEELREAMVSAGIREPEPIPEVAFIDLVNAMDALHSCRRAVERERVRLVRELQESEAEGVRAAGVFEAAAIASGVTLRDGDILEHAGILVRVSDLLGEGFSFTLLRPTRLELAASPMREASPVRH